MKYKDYPKLSHSRFTITNSARLLHLPCPAMIRDGVVKSIAPGWKVLGYSLDFPMWREDTVAILFEGPGFHEIWWHCEKEE